MIISDKTTAKPLDTSIIREAIEWLVRVQAHPADKELSEELHDWRLSHHDHELAWERIQRLNTELDQGFQSLPGKPLHLLESTALNIQQRRRTLKLLSLAFTAGASAWLIRDLSPWQELTADYVTNKGQRRLVALADGTQLVLNTNTAVNIKFTETERLIELAQGEILVTSGHKLGISNQPLRVKTKYGQFEALGTRFVVRLDTDSARLSVTEGKVAINKTDTIVNAGNSYIIQGGHIIQDKSPDMETDAWVDGVIEARNMRLQDFLKEISRYRTGYLRCDDAIADLRISGVFQLGNTEKLLAVLPETLPVKIEYMTRWWVTLHPYG